MRLVLYQGESPLGDVLVSAKLFVGPGLEKVFPKKAMVSLFPGLIQLHEASFLQTQKCKDFL